MVKKKGLSTIVILLLAMAAFLTTWPVAIDPVAWQAPPDPGYSGAYARNEKLAGVELLPLGGGHGPEAITLDREGRVYAATAEGRIIRLAADDARPEIWAETGGRPLGVEFDAQGRLLVADAYRGLLRLDPAGRITVLATEADGAPIRYANELAVATDGKVFFTDSSTKFGAEAQGGTYAASLLDIMEHGGHGRLLVYDPAADKATALLTDLNFPNGVALSPAQDYVLVVETGAYRVLRYWLNGPKAGQVEPFIEALPGFPDNLSAGRDGRYWLALISPRNALLDRLSDQPWLRKVVQRLPAWLRPQAKAYGHILALDGAGEVVLDLQDPTGRYPMNTAAVEGDDWLYLGSLTAPAVGRLAKAPLGL